MKICKSAKNIILSLFLVFSICCSAYSSLANSTSGIFFNKGNIAESYDQAKEEGKYLLVYIGASWCGPCKFMKNHIFTDLDLGMYVNNNYVVHELDGDSEDAKMFKLYYNVEVYPSFAFFNLDGSLLHFIEGGRATSELKDLAEQVVEGNGNIIDLKGRKHAPFQPDGNGAGMWANNAPPSGSNLPSTSTVQPIPEPSYPMPETVLPAVPENTLVITPTPNFGQATGKTGLAEIDRGLKSATPTPSQPIVVSPGNYPNPNSPQNVAPYQPNPAPIYQPSGTPNYNNPPNYQPPNGGTGDIVITNPPAPEINTNPYPANPQPNTAPTYEPGAPVDNAIAAQITPVKINYKENVYVIPTRKVALLPFDDDDNYTADTEVNDYEMQPIEMDPEAGDQAANISYTLPKTMDIVLSEEVLSEVANPNSINSELGRDGSYRAGASVSAFGKTESNLKSMSNADATADEDQPKLELMNNPTDGQGNNETAPILIYADLLDNESKPYYESIKQTYTAQQGNVPVEMLLEYAYLAKKFREPYNHLVNQYLESDTREVAQDKNVRFIFDFSNKLDNHAIAYLVNDIDFFKDKYGAERVNKKIKSAIRNSIIESILAGKQQQVVLDKAVALAQTAQFTDEKAFVFEMKSLYYKGNKQWDAYADLASNYIKQEKINDPTVLSNVVSVFHQYVTETKYLKQAVKWSEKSIKLDRSYFNLYHHAALLYRLGQDDMAVINALEARTLAIHTDAGTAAVDELITKMGAADLIPKGEGY